MGHWGLAAGSKAHWLPLVWPAGRWVRCVEDSGPALAEHFVHRQRFETPEKQGRGKQMHKLKCQVFHRHIITL